MKPSKADNNSILVKIQHNITYGRMIAIGYLLVIIVGALLLMLPWATKAGNETGFLTALFTSVSATCVTGLVVVDTSLHWTLFGKLVILLLIQIGGLGFITMGVLTALLLKKKINLTTRGLLKESINVNQVGGIVKLVRTICIGTAFIEGSGAFLLLFRFIPEYGFFKGVFFSIFHSISAFCNAGFDLMGEIYGSYSSFIAYKGDILVNTVLMLLIILGGLGFSVWNECKDYKFHIKKYSLHSKIVLSATGILLLAGGFLFFLFEKENLMAGMSAKDMFLTSAFSSVTPRTAGFNTIDTAGLSQSSKLLTIVLMFIGGSPGSTAGGIKTVTLVVLLFHMWYNLKGERDGRIFCRRFEEEAVKKASIVLLLSLIMATSATLAICYIQPLPLEDVLFEVVSAISTVGMSTGITRDLTMVSRIIIIVLMYCGRIGSMSFALFFMEKKKTANIQVPAEQVMIG